MLDIKPTGGDSKKSQLKDFFSNEVIKIIRENYDSEIQYYYRSYNILFNNNVKKEQKYLDMILKEEERKLLKKELNETIVDNYKASNRERYKRNKENIIPFYKSQKIKISDYYIKNNDILIDTTINHDTRNIINDIRKNYKRNKESELFEEINNII